MIDTFILNIVYVRKNIHTPNNEIDHVSFGNYDIGFHDFVEKNQI